MVSSTSITPNSSWSVSINSTCMFIISYVGSFLTISLVLVGNARSAKKSVANYGTQHRIFTVASLLSYVIGRILLYSCQYGWSLALSILSLISWTKNAIILLTESSDMDNLKRWLWKSILEKCLWHYFTITLHLMLYCISACDLSMITRTVEFM